MSVPKSVEQHRNIWPFTGKKSKELTENKTGSTDHISVWPTPLRIAIMPARTHASYAIARYEKFAEKRLAMYFQIVHASSSLS